MYEKKYSKEQKRYYWYDKNTDKNTEDFVYEYYDLNNDPYFQSVYENGYNSYDIPSGNNFILSLSTSGPSARASTEPASTEPASTELEAANKKINFVNFDEIEFFAKLNKKNCTSAFANKTENLTLCTKFSGKGFINDPEMLSKVYNVLKQFDGDNLTLINGVLDYNDYEKLNNLPDIIKSLDTTLSNFKKNLSTDPDYFIELSLSNTQEETKLFKYAIDAKRIIFKLIEIENATKTTTTTTNTKASIELMKKVIEELYENSLVVNYIKKLIIEGHEGKRFTDEKLKKFKEDPLPQQVKTKLDISALDTIKTLLKESIENCEGYQSFPPRFKLASKLSDLTTFETSPHPMADYFISISKGKLNQLKQENNERIKNDHEKQKTETSLIEIINKFLDNPRKDPETNSLNDEESLLIIRNNHTFLRLFTRRITEQNHDKAIILFSKICILIDNIHVLRHWFQDLLVPRRFYKEVRTKYKFCFSDNEIDSVVKSRKEKRTEKLNKELERRFGNLLKEEFEKYNSIYQEELEGDDFSDLFELIDGCRENGNNEEEWRKCLKDLNMQESQQSTGGRRSSLGKKKQSRRLMKRRTKLTRRNKKKK